MVWRYTEYAGCPYLTDWDKKKFKFGIILDEDTITGNPLTLEETIPHLIDVSKLPTNGVLRPHFYMRVGENSSSVFNLDFDRNKGLVRRMWTLEPGIVEIRGFPGEYQRLNPQKVDVGEFDDFKKIGEYAVRRFPFIAHEITESPYKFQEDVPDEEREAIESCFERVDIMPSWEVTQKYLSNDFWGLFSVYTLFEVGKDGLGQRQNPFTQEQVQELHRLVEPLKQN